MTLTQTNVRVKQRDGDILGFAHSRQRFLIWMLVLTALLILASMTAVAAGSVPINPAVILDVINHHLAGAPLAGEPTWSAAEDAIVWEVRVPRVLLGIAVGAGLAACGMALQAMVRNPLADPQLLGINSGASCGAAAAILVGFGLGLGEHSLQVMAFLGALVAAVVVYMLAHTGGRLSALRLLLAGVAVGYALNALTSFLVFSSGDAEGSRSVMFWLLGSLALASWGTPLFMVLIVTVLSVLILIICARRLDALTVGDETASTLGLSPAAVRTFLLVVVSACIGVIVAASGSIGFVGLVVPHLARRAVGSRHRHALPVAALMGAVLLILADLVARTILQPQELPIGIITALIGTPFLIILIRRTRAL